MVVMVLMVMVSMSSLDSFEKLSFWKLWFLQMLVMQMIFCWGLRSVMRMRVMSWLWILELMVVSSAVVVRRTVQGWRWLEKVYWFWREVGLLMLSAKIHHWRGYIAHVEGLRSSAKLTMMLVLILLVMMKMCLSMGVWVWVLLVVRIAIARSVMERDVRHWCGSIIAWLSSTGRKEPISVVPEFPFWSGRDVLHAIYRWRAEGRSQRFATVAWAWRQHRCWGGDPSSFLIDQTLCIVIRTLPPSLFVDRAAFLTCLAWSCFLSAGSVEALARIEEHFSLTLPQFTLPLSFILVLFVALVLIWELGMVSQNLQERVDILPINSVAIDQRLAQCGDWGERDMALSHGIALAIVLFRGPVGVGRGPRLLLVFFAVFLAIVESRLLHTDGGGGRRPFLLEAWRSGRSRGRDGMPKSAAVCHQAQQTNGGVFVADRDGWS